MKWDEWRGDLKGNPTFFSKHLFTLFNWRFSIHKFVQADAPNCFHSHPAIAYRFILWGWYWEQLAFEFDDYGNCIGSYFYKFRKWKFGKVYPDTIHRIEKVKVPTYTLWIRGPKTHEILLKGKGWHDN